MRRKKLNRSDVPLNTLLLGCVYSEEERDLRGQERRDRVRCDALEALGHDVYTLDDKHSAEKIQSRRHCQANFGDTRRMTKLMTIQWGYEAFDFIILDYFFSPVSWARERWTDSFFKETLVAFAENKRLKKRGVIILPNLQPVTELLELHENLIKQYYQWDFMTDAKENPLFVATENCASLLSKCPDLLTNENQLTADRGYSTIPFYALRMKTSD